VRSARTSSGAERSDRSHGDFTLKPLGSIPDWGVALGVLAGFALCAPVAAQFPEHLGSGQARALRAPTFPPEGWFMLGPFLFAFLWSGFVLRFAFDWGLGKHCLTLSALALVPGQVVMLTVPFEGHLGMPLVSALILGPLLAGLTLREETVWPGVALHYLANAVLGLFVFL
jgi:hypothetical protein